MRAAHHPDHRWRQPGLPRVHSLQLPVARRERGAHAASLSSPSSSHSVAIRRQLQAQKLVHVLLATQGGLPEQQVIDLQLTAVRKIESQQGTQTNTEQRDPRVAPGARPLTRIRQVGAPDFPARIGKVSLALSRAIQVEDHQGNPVGGEVLPKQGEHAAALVHLFGKRRGHDDAAVTGARRGEAEELSVLCLEKLASGSGRSGGAHDRKKGPTPLSPS